MKAARVLRHFGSNAVIQLLNIATSLIIIVFLSYDQLAFLAVTLLVAGPLGLLGTMRLEWIIFNANNPTATRITVQAGLFIAILILPCSFIIMTTLNGLGWLNFDLLGWQLICLGALYCSSFAIHRLITAYHLSRNSVKSNVRLRLLHAIVRIGSSLSLCATLQSAEAVLIGELLAVVTFLFCCREMKVFRRLAHIQRIAWAWLWRNHRRMLLSSTPSTMLVSFAAHLSPVVIISLVGVDAGGITYTVQRLAGIPVKFALTTVGEIWHKLVQRGDETAKGLARKPALILFGIVTVFAGMLVLVNGSVILAEWLSQNFIHDPRLPTLSHAVFSYQLFFAAALSVNLFDRVLVMNSAIHLKLIFDIIYLAAPIVLLLIWPMVGSSESVNVALFLLSTLQLVAYLVLAAIIMMVAARGGASTKVHQGDNGN